MDARQFWDRLEYRVCREINGLADEKFRHLWCDGFIAEQFEIVDRRPAMIGRVWMGIGGKHQEQWRFTLLLPPQVKAESEIDWAEILPAEDMTGWLSLDPSGKTVKINPAAVYPDRQWGAP